MDFTKFDTNTLHFSRYKSFVSTISKLIESFQRQNAKTNLLILHLLLLTYVKSQNLIEIEACQEAFELIRKPVEVLTAIGQTA